MVPPARCGAGRGGGVALHSACHRSSQHAVEVSIQAVGDSPPGHKRDVHFTKNDRERREG